MKLNLLCGICGNVRETSWDVEELTEATPDEVCPHCFICNECLDDSSLAMPLDEFVEKYVKPAFLP
jgi:hypothetical protein